MLSSRYRNSVPSIAMQLREILQPRIKEWLDRINEIDRQKTGNPPGWRQQHSGIVGRTMAVQAAIDEGLPEEIALGAIRTGRPNRHEIEKFAKGRFALVRENVLAEYEKQKTQVLRQVRLTGNRGGYVPALISWGVARVRKMVHALADAYVDEFIRYSVPSGERAEKDLQMSARQFAAGTIASIRGEIELMAKRTKRPLQNPGGDLNRKINAAMKSAVDEGLLNMKQRINSKGAEGTQVVDNSPSIPPSEQNDRGHSDFLEKLSEDDPNYTVAKRFHLEAWADSYALNAKAFAGRASLSDYVEGCINTFNQAARTQVAIQDAATIPEKCRQFDVMVMSPSAYSEKHSPHSRNVSARRRLRLLSTNTLGG
ncbi:MAG: hypothetical protein ABSG03_18820, partial [Bryobacteraceae bacterium]|jgi:hypothetical protein